MSTVDSQWPLSTAEIEEIDLQNTSSLTPTFKVIYFFDYKTFSLHAKIKNIGIFKKAKRESELDDFYKYSFLINF